MITFTPTREAALVRLNDFIPRAGRAYASNRNTDRGPDDRSNISALSPYIRRRIITEEEVVGAVLQRHSFDAAEKFVQEVAWRTYWKGWLEMRPAMLDRFDHERIALKSTLASDSTLQRRVQKAMDGRSGIECFDAWIDELYTHGWLHNHTRMWFASIWIFTLGLPWQLGADLFYKHLLDADPASNTLSWRWVAGLHTRGKHYVARAENIDRNTLGRFAPYGQLNEHADPLPEDAAPPSPSLMPYQPPTLNERVGLLLTEEDLHPESLPLSGEVIGVATLPTVNVSAPDSPAYAFSTAALDDATARAARHFSVAAESVEPEHLAAWAKGLGVNTLITSHAPVGMVARQLHPLTAVLAKEGIALTQIQRDWDRKLWPLATAGFFKLKTKLPKIVEEIQRQSLLL
jgi:deoxyribodipyrimidine photo-lyase